ncbi:MAG TPA: fibronectin type III domain-containing protein [Patescibacteria group bacterium]|nr:fibronectin type III domain-containing protein [Patescibacteria group bacterium]
MKRLGKVTALIIGGMIGLAAVFFGFDLVQRVFVRAEDLMPRSVNVSSVSDNSAVITWTTNQETEGLIEYGTSPTSLTFFAPETEKATSHSVTLTLLSPASTYYFHIKIGDKAFDNSGVPWTFITTKGGESKNEEVSPTETPYLSCVEESDCEVIKGKIEQGECLAIHYSQCLQKSQ